MQAKGLPGAAAKPRIRGVPLSAGLGRIRFRLGNTEHFGRVLRPKDGVGTAINWTIRHRCAVEQLGAFQNGLDGAERPDGIGRENENVDLAGAYIVPVNFRDASQLHRQAIFQLRDGVNVIERGAAELEHELAAHTRPMRPNEPR